MDNLIMKNYAPKISVWSMSRLGLELAKWFIIGQDGAKIMW